MATDLFLPADGLRLLGQHEGSGVRPGDGQVVQLPLLPYLIMAAIAEGGVDGGWSADQIGARVGTASGQGLTADTVRYLVAGKLAPLGLIADDGADRPAGPPVGSAAPGDAAARADDQRRAAARLGARAVGRAASWPTGHRLGRLLPPHRRRRWALAVGGAAALVCVAATAPIMAETGNGVAGRNRSAAAPVPTPAAASVSCVGRRGQPDAGRGLGGAAGERGRHGVCDPGCACSCGGTGSRPPGFGRCRPASAASPVPDRRRHRGRPRSVRSDLAAGDAPQVIASFGPGAGRVDVRAIVPAGAAAFRTQLAAEQTALACVRIT